jgi:hypothetical protein
MVIQGDFTPEYIRMIEEFGDKYDYEGKAGGYSGYRITTSKQVIELGIWNVQDCCEIWGYFMSEDDLDSFLGAHLYDVRVVDTAQNVESLKKRELDYTLQPYPEDDWSVDRWANLMFVNLETDRGTLQFVAYNEHNGYYGHDAYVKARQLEVCRRL